MSIDRPQNILKTMTVNLTRFYEEINFKYYEEQRALIKMDRLNPKDSLQKLTQWGAVQEVLKNMQGQECKGESGIICKTTHPSRVIKYQFPKNHYERFYALQELILLQQATRKGAPHIVRQYDGAILQKKNRSIAFAVLLEYAGDTISDLYTYRKKPSLKDVERIIKQILEGVQFLHSFGILHGDLKPENIAEWMNQIRILDVGLAHIVGHGTSPSLLFSHFYRPPETTFRRKTGLPGDIWSVGCIIFELVTGTPLFPVIESEDPFQNEVNMFSAYKMRLKIEDFPTELVNSDMAASYQETWQSRNFKAKRIPPLDFYRPAMEKALKKCSRDQSKILYLLDLMEKMLQVDPQKRIKAVHALLHPFFTENPSDLCFHPKVIGNQPFAVDILDNFGNLALRIPNVHDMASCYHLPQTEKPYHFQLISLKGRVQIVGCAAQVLQNHTDITIHAERSPSLPNAAPSEEKKVN